MGEIGAFEAKNTLGALLDRVALGEEILITRRGRPVAKLVPADSGVDRDRMLAAAARIRERARQFGGPFDWEEWKGYRDEGRP